ncbi:hypothetical protein NDU88_008541 [Pleurodeles waltl]|uniref:Uncharacterized protein n=1 Tax=Pleurodeles waltl TaxID=8319 RepID=A0AAV7N8R1_PLEWA|nr:hypothetical protein NDU88_008541 [Pleurodeles waltl]
MLRDAIFHATVADQPELYFQDNEGTTSDALVESDALKVLRSLAIKTVYDNKLLIHHDSRQLKADIREHGLQAPTDPAVATTGADQTCIQVVLAKLGSGL